MYITRQKMTNIVKINNIGYVINTTVNEEK